MVRLLLSSSLAWTHQNLHRVGDAQALGALVGEDPAFVKAVAQLPAAARSDAAVLISGETGTGKELVARAIHYLSDRAPLPFVSVNCGSPGGSASGRCAVRSASRHVLLDEVGGALDRPGSADAPARGPVIRPPAPGSSAQRRAAGPVRGRHERRPVAARGGPGPSGRISTIACAVFSISLPSLRERKDDILPLALHFLKKHARARAALCSRWRLRRARGADGIRASARQRARAGNAMIRAG